MPTISQQSDAKKDRPDHISYALVTPVRNEEDFIGRTIASVTNQTIQPTEWIIVSDGSTDKTDAIINDAIKQNAWIKLIQLPQREKASFAAVVENTTLGIKSLESKTHKYIGLLDSDLEFQKDYFEKLIAEFEVNVSLGLAGGVAIDIGLPKNIFPRNKLDVPGALQFFRRSCLESIGGLIAIPEGGWDCLTCAKARMEGWQTKLVTSLVVDHLKPRNTTQGGVLRRKCQMGVRDYALGYHPIFETIKCIGRIFREKPLIIASALWWLGYIQCYIVRRPRSIPPELIRFIRKEQNQRLFRYRASDAASN